MTLAAIIFDFDGVIADSEPLHLRAYQEVLVDPELRLSAAEYYGRYLGFDDSAMLRMLAADRHVPMDDERVAALVARKSERFDALLADTSVLFPGADACVRRCAAEVPLAIASGACGYEIAAILAGAGLEDCFRAIVASGDTARGKPAPDPYLRAIERLGVDGRCTVAIEDSHWGLVSARAAGLHTVAVAHTYPAGQLCEADLVVPDVASITVPMLRRLLSA